MNETNRVPAGVPTGGQFATSTRAEADVALSGPPFGTHLHETIEAMNGTRTMPSATAPCPDCGAEMPGNLGNGKFLPGSSCPACPHTAAEMEVYGVATDEDGSYTYALDEQGSIGAYDPDGDCVEAWTVDDPSWANEASHFGVSRDAVHLAIFRRDEDPEEALEPALDYAVAAGMLNPADRDRLTSEDLETIHRGTFAPAIDALASEYYGLAAKKDLHPESRDHVVAACHDAGLRQMVAVYRGLEERRVLTNGSALLLDASDVRRDYENHIEPAYAAVAQRAEAIGRARRVDDLVGRLTGIDEYISTIADEDDQADASAAIKAYDQAAEAAWTAFDDSGSRDVKAYASALHHMAENHVWDIATALGYNTEMTYDDLDTARATNRDAYLSKRFSTVQDRLKAVAQSFWDFDQQAEPAPRT